MRRTLIWSGLPCLVYLFIIPYVGVQTDHRFAFRWPLVSWLSWLGAPLLAIGLAIAAWCVRLFATLGGGTPNPMQPPVRLVESGPYRYSRNPMMLAGWMAGLGLALLLQSVTVLAAYGFIVAAGSLYVPLWEEPRMERRFGECWRTYRAHTPRWFGRHGVPHHA